VSEGERRRQKVLLRVSITSTQYMQSNAECLRGHRGQGIARSKMENLQQLPVMSSQARAPITCTPSPCVMSSSRGLPLTPPAAAD